MAKLVANRDLKNLAFNILHEKLVNCEYAPGMMLNEAQLSTDLGFSRTPIRESLSRLEQDGFIRILPKKGIYVTDITLNDVMQTFQARMEIEPVALIMAGPHLPMDELIQFRDKFNGEETDVKTGFHLDTAMHMFIIEHCGNRFIIDMMRKVFDENTRIVIASKQDQVKIHDARQEHKNILNLLIEKKYDSASDAMRAHVETCRHAAVDFFLNKQYYTPPAAETYKSELKKVF